MSDLISNIGNAARRVASGVSTELSVAALEQKIKDAHRVLGNLYFQAVSQGQPPQGPEFDAQVATIRRLQKEIRIRRQSHDINA